MGIEPSSSLKQKDFIEFEHNLKIMLGKYGSTEVLTLIRKTYEESLK